MCDLAQAEKGPCHTVGQSSGVRLAPGVARHVTLSTGLKASARTTHGRMCSRIRWAHLGRLANLWMQPLVSQRKRSLAAFFRSCTWRGRSRRHGGCAAEVTAPAPRKGRRVASSTRVYTTATASS
eukprot:359833-Chlamydomonas_euryale.AAC.9